MVGFLQNSAMKIHICKSLQNKISLSRILPEHIKILSFFKKKQELLWNQMLRLKRQDFH